MLISEAYPSKYLKESDLKGAQITVTISHVEEEDLGDDTRPVAYFEGKAKGLVLNKTNAFRIASGYGDDTKGWAGKPITLYPDTTQNPAGQTVPCIRVRVPSKEALSDEIPF